ncbi:MAG TPA: ATP-binding protein [Aliidongia sp.]|nr:ATP-binding protein [Aliidongia sp.]
MNTPPRSNAVVSDVQVQLHGCVMVFDRPDLNLIHASENVQRLLPIDLRHAFGAPVQSLLGDKLAQRIHSLAPIAEERRTVMLPAGSFDMRLVADGQSVLVELEPADAPVDVRLMGALLETTAANLAEATSLRDVAQIVCTRFAEAASYSLVALARTVAGGVEIIGESRDSALPSLFGRAATAQAIVPLTAPSRLAVVADLAAAPVRLLSAPGIETLRPVLGRAELLAPSLEQMDQLREYGAAAAAVVPLSANDEVWGHLVAEHWHERRLTQAARRFALDLGPLVVAAAERLERSARQRARRLAADAVIAFDRACADGHSPVEALLFGERLLAVTAGADGVALLCGADCIVVGRGPSPDTMIAKLPSLAGWNVGKIWTTDRLSSYGAFTAEERSRTGGMMAVMIAASPRIGLVAFRQEQEPAEDGAATVHAWEPHRIEAFLALAAALRQTLVASDSAAAAELGFQIGEFGQRAFGAGRLRSAIMESSSAGAALISGRDNEPLRLVESNGMFRRLFGLEPQDLPIGTAETLARRLGVDPSRLIDSGKPASEVEIWSPELGPRIVEIDTRSIVRARIDGRGAGLTLVQATDLTRIRRQEVAMRMSRDQALALIRMRDEMLANMSHELRTPLNAIIGFADMISQEVLGPVGVPRYVAYARDIESAGQHLLSLINDVLDLSRLNSGKQVAAEETVDLVELVRSCLDWARVASPERALGMLVEEVDPGLCLLCDDRALRQVLINLVSNAIKFSGENGQVTLRLALRLHEPAVIEVIDDGIGMSAAELNRAFEPFFRGGGAYQRRIDGAGLGLAIAKGLIELHGGSLALTSVEGLGTTARIELPPWRVVEHGK